MIRALWTGASGMIAQQDAVDTISNNLANVNTVGYKKETVEFKTLLYSKLQTKTTDNNGNPKPVIGQVGAGVRTSSITSRYTQGNLTATGNLFDFALEGSGFFQVQMPDGSIGYTRNGSFSMSIGTEGLTLCTADGYPVLNDSGEPIVFDLNKETSKFNIDEITLSLGIKFLQSTKSSFPDKIIIMSRAITIAISKNSFLSTVFAVKSFENFNTSRLPLISKKALTTPPKKSTKPSSVASFSANAPFPLAQLA